jgi:hypothetical protein
MPPHLAMGVPSFTFMVLKYHAGLDASALPSSRTSCFCCSKCEFLVVSFQRRCESLLQLRAVGGCALACSTLRLGHHRVTIALTFP